jgi:hypothetical protein
VPSGSLACTVTVVDFEVAPGAEAVMVMVAGLGTAFGAIKSPVFASIIPAVAAQVTLDPPVTVAVYCQFAPTPIVEGGEPLIVIVPGWPPPPLDDPPQAASGRSAKKKIAR